jgi:hypothetical protein
MHALIVNCTLKRFLAASNTEVLARSGYTVPGHAWTYLNRGPGPEFIEEEAGCRWSVSTGQTAPHNPMAVARALRDAPMPAAAMT